ncbi:hypothetical protein LOTGIDRAFT_157872 [Lottia gigantea]|uniref:Aquaglyceroporin-3 n=1 Tax=Lottia gigantea TaxID=225164 RepID=V4ATH5_LOTGI|nr:hypothetical protein LOTGIDRAFT_157872 [Lottia gigantea]ESP00593.1 hypothetical protein LOTGIDRAFT_157872 [Lottia gigantea]
MSSEWIINFNSLVQKTSQTFGNGSVAQVVLSKGTAGGPETIYWSWGLGVTMGVYVAGGISGAHLNPAVTLTMACLKKTSWKRVPFYMLAQYLGAFIASVMVFVVYLDSINNYDGGIRAVIGDKSTAGIWSTYPQSHLSTINGFGDQIFGTALLLICVLAVTDRKNMKPDSGLVPLSIGLIVVVIGMTFGYNCGYAINPARDLGPRIFTAIAGWGEEPFSFRNYNWFWVPVIGSHIGALVGAAIYQLCVGLHWPLDQNDEILKIPNNVYENEVSEMESCKKEVDTHL